jgi:ubiquinone/menaquinone biosynthesis C-methylase UbiE
MTGIEYEYHGMMAETWDLFRGDTSNWDDRAFYLEIIAESGPPVLDVGCGTGRLLIDYRSQGMDIDGVDISPEMLKFCQKKLDAMGLKANLYEGDMQTMRLLRQYQTIMVPSSSFQLVLELKDADKAIANLFAHLLPGGTLVMPFMRLRKKDERLEHDWEISGEVKRPTDSAIMRRWSKSRFDPNTQLEHNEDRYELIKDGVIVATEQHVRSPATRQYSQWQAMDLFVRTGLVDLRMYKGFTHEPAAAEDEIFTICGVRP